MLDDFSLTFRPDGTLTVAADLNDQANADGSDDLDVTLPYTVSGSVVTVNPSSEAPLRLEARATSQDAVERAGDGLLVSAFLGADLLLSRNDSATLTIRRR